MRVDPNNRLVADTLETQWNEKLRLLTQAKEAAEQQRDVDAVQITDEQEGTIRALAADFPRLWRDPKTLDRDRKRMARLLLEDVTLRSGAFQGRCNTGASRAIAQAFLGAVDDRTGNHQRNRSVTRAAQRFRNRPHPQRARFIHGLRQSVRLFNVSALRRTHHLKSRRQRLSEQGWMTSSQVASLLGCSCTAVPHWHNVGLLQVISLTIEAIFFHWRPTAEPAATQVIAAEA